MHAHQGLIVVTGPTGSGKLLSKKTPILTSKGWKTMGELKVGDEVFGRDGKFYEVAGVSDVNENPELYLVTFSDGTTLEADIDHQWLVASHASRNAPRTTKRKANIRNFQEAQKVATELFRLSALENSEDGYTDKELFDYLVANDVNWRWNKPRSLYDALHMTDCEWSYSTRPRIIKTEVVRTETALVFDAKLILEHYVNNKSAGAYTQKLAAKLLKSGNYPVQISAKQACELLGVKQLRPNVLAKKIGQSGDRVTFTNTYEIDEVRDTQVVEYPLSQALESLAERINQQYPEAPDTDVLLERLTTREMLDRGLKTAIDQTNWAVPVSKALKFPEQELIVDPYVFGVWLGDGSTDSGVITSDHKNGDQDHLLYQLDMAGYMPHILEYSIKSVRSTVLRKQLKKIGVLGHKQIPDNYKMSSFEQRLAVVQGLMDTDGTISKDGACELSLSNEELINDALYMIRSLGIKASISRNQPAGYRDEHGNYVKCKDRHRIKFTTNLPVFRLPRKLERIPKELRETNKWNYVVSIEPIDPVPGLCISVNSPDHTYLAGESLTVTSNSTLLAAMLDEANKTRRDHILTIEDPVEFTHKSQLCTVTQREVGEDTKSFASGLKAALREDPDIILVGELRDQETTQAAIEAADTGHLVLATMHTRSAPETVTRIVNIFPEGLQQQIQTSLASGLLAVVTQTLVKTVDGKGRAPAQEVMILNDGIRNQIRAGKLEQIASALQAGSQDGMHTMSDDLARLVREGKISIEAGAEKAPDVNEFYTKIGRNGKK